MVTRALLLEPSDAPLLPVSLLSCLPKASGQWTAHVCPEICMHLSSLIRGFVSVDSVT